MHREDWVIQFQWKMSWFNGLVVEKPQNTKTQRNNQFIISEGIFNFLRGKKKKFRKSDVNEYSFKCTHLFTIALKLTLEDKLIISLNV